MLAKDFVNEFIDKKVMNTKINDHAVEDFIREKLEIKTYLPFQTKREIVEMIVTQHIKEEGGIKKIDDISQYLSFICAMLISHTNLELSKNPSEDYDELSKHGLLELIIDTFRKDYSECEALLKMAVANELADNNLSVVVGKFLNDVLAKLDGFGEVVKGFTENIDLSKLLGTNIKEEDVAKILGFVDKFKK